MVSINAAGFNVAVLFMEMPQAISRTTLLYIYTIGMFVLILIHFHMTTIFRYSYFLYIYLFFLKTFRQVAGATALDKWGERERERERERVNFKYTK